MSASRSSVARNYFRPSLRILFTAFLETKPQLWKLMSAISGCCIGSSGYPLQSFTDERINSDDSNKTASDNEITKNCIEHHLSDSITSVENLNVKNCDCIMRLESLKDEFILKAINIKRNLVLKIENLKDEMGNIRKDIETTFDKNLIGSINQPRGKE